MWRGIAATWANGARLPTPATTTAWTQLQRRTYAADTASHAPKQGWFSSLWRATKASFVQAHIRNWDEFVMPMSVAVVGVLIIGWWFNKVPQTMPAVHPRRLKDEAETREAKTPGLSAADVPMPHGKVEGWGGRNV
ncbi:hypothetical protein QOT17_002631 [Balamuthia mandrillaris]